MRAITTRQCPTVEAESTLTRPGARALPALPLR
jgi:hypothetical protein